jgi:hypothetical protein
VQLAANPVTLKRLVFYKNRAWSYVELDATGTAYGGAISGCLLDERAKTLAALLARATWKSHRAKAMCFGMSTAYTEYKVGDKTVWTAKMCQPETLDDASSKLVAFLDKLTAELQLHAAPSTGLLGTGAHVGSSQPRQCSPMGAPMFGTEVRDLRTKKHPIATLDVYGNGAWTKTQYHGGDTPVTTGGCLATDELALVKAVVDAPWKIAHAQITCEAMAFTLRTFRVNGRDKLTEKMCGPDTADTTTAAAIEKLGKLVEPGNPDASFLPTEFD